MTIRRKQQMSSLLGPRDVAMTTETYVWLKTTRAIKRRDRGRWHRLCIWWAQHLEPFFRSG